MADTVQFYLERMVPELEDLEKKGLFSKVEIKSIVKKRTNFEYALKRRIAKKIDFLRYIEYEMNLDTLRKKRKDRFKDLKNQKLTISDHAGQRRIFFLFERATNKFRGDLSLWMQYIDYLKKCGARNLLSGVFGKAIQLHPTKAPLWIMAASWEYEGNANMAAARMLMQRALRVNPTDESLYHEYFRLELLYVEKIKARRRVLGISDQGVKKTDNEEEDNDTTMDEDENTIKLPTITGEEVENWNDETDERKTVKKLEESAAEAMKEGVNPILGGLLAQIIYDNAIQAISNKLDFRTKFVDIYREFSDTDNGCQHVYDTIRRDMGNVPAARKYLAERHLFAKKPVRSAADLEEEASPSVYISVSDPQFVEAVKNCVRDFDQAVADVPQPEMWELYIDFLFRWQQLVQEENLKLYFTKLLQKVFKSSQKQNITSENLYSQWIEFLTSQDNLTQAQQKATIATEKYPHCARLWVARIRLASVEAVTDEPQQGLYKKALAQNMASFELWSSYNSWLILQWQENTMTNEALHELYLDACNKATTLLPSVMASTADRNQIKDLILSGYVSWAAQAEGIESARKVYKKIIQTMYPTLGFYKQCLEVEDQHPDDGNACENVEYLYEMILRLNVDKADIYRAYITYLTSQKKFKKANHIQWRASNEIESWERM
ncbi:U3 small nucleolar RNA-associated protein 6-domain-containing protein [Radiomyces spectabilis]|uniref:U3 small nucleolar RNA-associated protein 6-domain-containing protein n=1 Tax=Radiomyces spectabilis TaxID=64574 RepID=UPI0022207D28|nr:U3 small nucleolar RNA-associated protein 6-domain-containing protein [Radiomyces spectabilis]KAI8371436.1 U3 small nucleolar RNA-associated protein 6-domain-containing protein [Radiomyces spectabilis]